LQRRGVSANWSHPRLDPVLALGLHNTRSRQHLHSWGSVGRNRSNPPESGSEELIHLDSKFRRQGYHEPVAAIVSQGA
jgi:hypothetical protein